jgi:hypothetical protein
MKNCSPGVSCHRNYPTVENVRQKLQREEWKEMTGAVATACDLRSGKRKKKWRKRLVQQNSSKSVANTNIFHMDSVPPSKVAASAAGYTSGLQALADYGSNSEDDESDRILAKPSEGINSTVSRLRTVNTEKKQKDEQQQQTPKNLISSGRRKSNCCPDSSKVTRKPNGKAQPTLLQKLLVKEIQRERNILLQCIRYIVQKDFFRPP